MDIEASVQAVFSLLRPNETPPEGFCWRLLFPPTHALVIAMPEQAFVPVSTLQLAKDFQTDKLLAWEMRGDIVHIKEDPNGKLAEVVVMEFPDEQVVGGHGVHTT